MPRPALAGAVLLAVLVALAWMRGIDHDESQYVAAARLTAAGLLPYRDYAYLQTPLQPFAFAPLVWLFGPLDLAWPALRIANALLGGLTVAATWRAMRTAGVDERTATMCAGLFATCDILLFSAGTARNDALPAALFAVALVPILRAERGDGTMGGALLAGLLLSAAAAAKVSYALPAATYGIWALLHHRHRPTSVALGALPSIVLVAALAAAAPDGFAFGTLIFPARAPAEWYAATGRAWKLGLAIKAIDTAKFLALGPALLALVLVARWGRPSLLAWLTLAGVASALLPSPTWRQYLLPALPPLFVMLALRLERLPPARGWYRAFAGFAAIGLVPSIVAVTSGTGMIVGVAETRALAVQSVGGTVATLSPQFLPDNALPDPRFATGPFYFRSRALVTASREARLHLVSHPRLTASFAMRPPDFILVGGEGTWASGTDELDRLLERWAVTRGWGRVDTGGRLRLYAPPAARRAALPAIRPE
ncbi:4-amino-4-deoxy-L-arabinose transferase [Sphingomonas guangdongensis]|uniref:4-amino-4-deoxy-L-arabinose transferase n=1 Tax=Sphingomonas guangdongensis TaxID=1141890 RepID=A0A285QHL8_9SPHN|nr:4-amino-4-deoxy-L-arabinose transferase [Sphingomonas guangdongensis]